MLASLTSAVLNLTRFDLKARLRAMSVTAVLTLIGVALMLTGMGFGMALLYVWLQRVLGTLIALAVIVGGCVLLALIFFAFAAWRAKPRARAAYRASSPPPSAASSAATDHIIDEAITAMQQGSREQLLVTLTLALAVGIILGRRA